MSVIREALVPAGINREILVLVGVNSEVLIPVGVNREGSQTFYASPRKDCLPGN